jgi:hypothetical protein
MYAVVRLGPRATQFTIDNLSLGGARLIGSMALRLGQRVDIELVLDTDPLALVGEVVRVDTPDLLEDQIAVRFVDPPACAKAAIRDVVVRRLADAEPGDDEPTGAASPLIDELLGRASDPVIGKLGDDEPDIEVDADVHDPDT